MAEDAARTPTIGPRLGRGLAALLGDAAADAPGPPQSAAGPRKAPIEFLRPNPRNPAQVLRRRRARGARRLDPRARRHPAGAGAADPARRRRLRDHRRRAALARRPARRPARNSDHRRRSRRPRGARNRHRRECPARRSQRPRGGCGLRASSAPTTAIRTATSPASSARAAATSPTRCASTIFPSTRRTLLASGRHLGRTRPRAACGAQPDAIADRDRRRGPHRSRHRAAGRERRQDRAARRKPPATSRCRHARA